MLIAEGQGGVTLGDPRADGALEGVDDVGPALLGGGNLREHLGALGEKLAIQQLLAALVGAGLSVSGCVFQSMFANPLATPDTLGVASGASFGAALALLLVFGLGCMNVTLIRTVEDLWFTEFYHVTWIPWLVMGLAVIGCLALLGALRPLKVQSPWNYAPALVLGLILCIGTSSPLVWIEFDSSRWNVPYTLVFLYALFAVEFVRLLLRAEARGTPFAWKEAAKLVGLLALAYAPALLSQGVYWLVDNVIPQHSTLPIRVAGWITSALFLLGGAMGMLVARRGRRGAGALLVILTVVCLALYLLVAYNILPYGWPESEWPLALRVLKTRFYEGLMIWNSMSAYGFALFAGIKCLLPEKR